MGGRLPKRGVLPQGGSKTQQAIVEVTEVIEVIEG